MILSHAYRVVNSLPNSELKAKLELKLKAQHHGIQGDLERKFLVLGTELHVSNTRFSADELRPSIREKLEKLFKDESLVNCTVVKLKTDFQS